MTTVETTTDHPDHRMYRPFKGTYGRLSLGQFPVVDLEAPDDLPPIEDFLARNLAATHSHRSQVVTCRLRSGKVIDWDFDLLAVDQSAADYWGAQVKKIIDAGVTRIDINASGKYGRALEWT